MKVELQHGHLIKVKIKNRNELLINLLMAYKKKYNDKENVPRPDYWSGWNFHQQILNFG